MTMRGKKTTEWENLHIWLKVLQKYQVAINLMLIVLKGLLNNFKIKHGMVDYKFQIIHLQVIYHLLLQKY